MRARAARAWAVARQALARLRGGELTPGRAAGSVAVGVAVGCVPVFGAQSFIAAAIALALRLDAVVAVLATNVANPLTAPFVVWLELEVGSWLRTGRGLGVSLAEVRARPLATWAADAAVGALVVGSVLASLGALVAWALVARARGRRIR